MFTFDIRYLKACNIITPKDSHRLYLEGVAVQWDGATLVSVATDGHRMIAFKIDYLADEGCKPFSMIIPRSTIELIKFDKNDTTCTLDPETKTLSYNGAKLSFTPIDGVFPDWQRVCPQSTSGKVSQFNPKYLVDFEKACSLWSKGTKIHVSPNGDGPAIVTFTALEVEGFGVLMPYREASNPLTSAPEWVTNFKSVKLEDAA